MGKRMNRSKRMKRKMCVFKDTYLCSAIACQQSYSITWRTTQLKFEAVIPVLCLSQFSVCARYRIGTSPPGKELGGDKQVKCIAQVLTISLASSRAHMVSCPQFKSTEVGVKKNPRGVRSVLD